MSILTRKENNLQQGDIMQSEDKNKLTVDEMLDLCQRLKADGKGDYAFNLDGYFDIDIDIEDDRKSVRLW